MNMLDDWQRVKAVFEQALAVDEPERSAFLAAACGSDRPPAAARRRAAGVARRQPIVPGNQRERRARAAAPR